MSEIQRKNSIRRRVALLVGFGTIAPMLLFTWLAVSGLEDFSGHLRAERQRLAQSLAASVDHQLQQSLASLVTAAVMSRDASPEDFYRSLRAIYLRTAIWDGLFVLNRDKQVDWQEFRRAPVSRDALPRELDQAFASGKQTAARLAEPAGARTVLMVPLRDWDGKFTHMVCAVVSPAAPAWSPFLRQVFLGSATAELTDAPGEESPFTADGEAIAVARLERVPWQLVLRQPKGDAMGSLQNRSRPLLLLAPLLVLLAMGFAWGASRSVTEPLAALDRAAARIAGGNLQTSVPSQGGDEVGRLSQSLEQMRLALKQSLDDLTRSRDVLDERVKERTRELRELLTKFVSAQEDERKRLARELHDETCQTLAALGMKLDAALAAPTAEGAREQLTEARVLAGRGLAEIHGLIYDLRPSVLDDLGLFASIRWLA
ncbi:MAG TPA: histidine kinase, partial [Polyangia bacterium]